MVDDGSSDDTPAVLAAEQARRELPLAFVRHHEGRGPATARNRGWRLASASVDRLHRRRLRAHAGLARGPAATRPRAGTRRSSRAGRCPTPPRRTSRGPSPRRWRSPSRARTSRPATSPTRARCSSAWAASTRASRAPRARTRTSAARAIAAGGGRPASSRRRSCTTPCSSAARSEALRDALLATDDLRAYRLNPELRANLQHGGLLRPLAPAAHAGRGRGPAVPAAPQQPALLRAVRRQRARSLPRRSGAPPWHAPFFVAFDALQIAATVRGAVRERVMVI